MAIAQWKQQKTKQKTTQDKKARNKNENFRKQLIFN